MFVDPDDYVGTDIVEKLLNNIDDETDIVCCGAQVKLNNDFINISFFKENIDFQNETKLEMLKQLLDPSYRQQVNPITAIGVPWGKLYRMRLIESNGLRFDEKLIRMQDNIFNCNAVYYSNKIKYVNENLYFYSVDNIFEYNNKYWFKLDEIFKNVLISRELFFNLLSASEKNMLLPYFRKEGFNFFNTLNYFYINNSNNSIKHLKNFIHRKVEETPYSKLFSENIKYINDLSCIGKLKFYLLKYNMLSCYIHLNKLIFLLKDKK